MRSKRNFMTSALSAALDKRISLMREEQGYLDALLKGIGSTGSSVSSTDVTGERQLGTGVPVWYGQQNTFISNPSNVDIGTLSRMVETDDTVLCAAQFKSLMMISKIGEYQNDDLDKQGFVRDFLKKMYGPTWPEALEGMSSDGVFGFSTSEVMWGLNKNNEKVPKRIKTYHPSTICFEVDPWGDITADGVVQFVLQNGQSSNPNHYMPYFKSGFEVKNPFETPQDRLLPYRMPFIANYGLVRIPREKCIHHVNNEMLSFGSPYGKSPVRAAHLAWQLKVFLLRQMGVAAKRQGTPFLWATAPQNTNKVKVRQRDGTDKQMTPVEALDDILAHRQTDDAVVTGPEQAGYKIQSLAIQCDLSQFIDLINACNSWIFRAFLLPSLVMTDGQSGSRSLGDKHFEIVDRIAEKDADRFSMKIVNQMIRKAIIENYGEQDDYGHFGRRPQSIEERKALSTMFAEMCAANIMQPTNKKDNQFIRSTLHLPEQEDSFFTQPNPNDPRDYADGSEGDENEKADGDGSQSENDGGAESEK